MELWLVSICSQSHTVTQAPRQIISERNLKMPPFSPAQSKSLPMKTRLKLKLAKIIQSEKNDERRSLKIKPINHPEETAPVLRRTQSLRSLQETSWSIGRGKFVSSPFVVISDQSFIGKGGKKLPVGGGLIKSLPEKSFQEWTKMHKESTKKLIQKRKEIQLSDVGASPTFDKSKQKGQSNKTKNRKCGK